MEPRCEAKLSNGAPCTRRTQQGCKHCGTHQKQFERGDRLELTLITTKGIDHFVDLKTGLMYRAEDVMNNAPDLVPLNAGASAS
jgi:hypothetical protein